VKPITAKRPINQILSVFDVFVILVYKVQSVDRLCGPVVRVPGHRSRGPGSISGATSFSEK
jgi:hypothetical protein